MSRVREITVFECRRTGDLFRKRKAYDAHLKKMVKQRIFDRDSARRRRNRDALVAPLYRCTTFREIELWLVEHVEFLQSGWGSSGREKLSRVVDIRLHGMKFGDQSNSHSAPLGKSTNWGGSKPDQPRNYPGWSGHIAIRYEASGRREYDFLKRVGICTGGGGGGGDVYNFGVTLWDQDFPLLREPQILAPEPIGFLHDVFHFDRLVPKSRASDWYDCRKKIKELHAAGVPTAFGMLTDDIDLLARAFGATTYRYFVKGSLDYKICEQFKYASERNKPIPFLYFGNRMWQMREFLMEEPDLAIEWKLRGDLPAHAEIIDLGKRAERLLAEGKITSLSPQISGSSS